MLDQLNVGQLEEQLAAARGQRDRLDRVIDWLEEGVALFAGEAPAPELPAADEPVDQEDEDTTIAGGGSPSEEPAQLPPAPEPVPPAPDAPIRPSRPMPPVRATTRDIERKVLGVILNSNRPLPFAEIEAAVAGGRSTIRTVLQRLVKDGQVVATGATKSRRYGKGQHEFHSELRVQQEKTAEKNRAKVQDGIDRVVFRDHVAKAIAGDPGCLNEDRLALALEADRDDIAEACTWLLEHHQIEVNDDGTYSRHTQGRARLRSAA